MRTPLFLRYSDLGEEVFQRIRKLLGDGVKAKEIAKKVGCTTSTVYRTRREMEAESGEAPDS